MSKYLLCDYPSLKDVECHIKRQRWISCEVAEARMILEHFSEQIVATWSKGSSLGSCLDLGLGIQMGLGGPTMNSANICDATERGT